MSYTELISKVIEQMKKARGLFNSSGDQEGKTKAYHNYVDQISNLNKILKGSHITENAKNKIRDIIRSGIQEAGQMKASLASGGGNSGGAGPNRANTGGSNNGGGGGGGRGTNLSNNNSSTPFIISDCSLFYIIK